MKDILQILKKSPLFQDIDDSNLLTMLNCLNAKRCNYLKGQEILSEGAPATHVGLVISGQVQIAQIDYYGNRSIIANAYPSQLFGESFACADVCELPINITAICDTEILLINCQRIMNTCNNACIFHNQIIYNLMKIIATKNLILNQKILITSKRSTREKLIAFLLAEAQKNRDNFFTIPYDRQELADYLGVDRSGLSSEIGKLRKAGYIEVNKNSFQILKELVF